MSFPFIKDLLSVRATSQQLKSKGIVGYYFKRYLLMEGFLPISRYISLGEDVYVTVAIAYGPALVCKPSINNFTFTKNDSPNETDHKNYTSPHNSQNVAFNTSCTPIFFIRSTLFEKAFLRSKIFLTIIKRLFCFLNRFFQLPTSSKFLC